MKIKFNLSLLFLAAVACSENAPREETSQTTPISGENGEGDSEPMSSTSAVYAVGTRIRYSSGRSFYLTLVDDLSPQKLDLSNSLEASGFAYGYAYDGSIFLMDSESLTITRYEVTDELQFVEGDRFSMAAEGVTRFNKTFYFISPTRAVFLDGARSQYVYWNPQTMTVVEARDTGLPSRGDLSAKISVLFQDAERLIVPHGWWRSFGISSFEFEDEIGLQILDRETGDEIALSADSRCALPEGGFFDERGDLYILGRANAGIAQYAASADGACMLRLKKGENEFDPEFFVDVSKLVGSDYVTRVAGKGSRFITQVLGIEATDESIESALTQSRDQLWDWQLVDLEKGTSTSFGLPLSDVAFNPFILKDEQLAFQFEDIEGGTSTLYLVEGEQAKESFTIAGEILQMSRLR